MPPWPKPKDPYPQPGNELVIAGSGEVTICACPGDWQNRVFGAVSVQSGAAAAGAADQRLKALSAPTTTRAYMVTGRRRHAAQAQAPAEREPDRSRDRR